MRAACAPRKNTRRKRANTRRMCAVRTRTCIVRHFRPHRSDTPATHPVAAWHEAGRLPLLRCLSEPPTYSMAAHGGTQDTTAPHTPAHRGSDTGPRAVAAPTAGTAARAIHAAAETAETGETRRPAHARPLPRCCPLAPCARSAHRCPRSDAGPCPLPSIAAPRCPVTAPSCRPAAAPPYCPSSLPLPAAPPHAAPHSSACRR